MERQRTQHHYHLLEKSGSDTIKGGRDTALEVEVQLYKNNIIVEYNASKSKRKCKVIEPAK